MTFIRHIPVNLKEELRLHGVNPSDLVLYINSACNLRCKHCYVGDVLLGEGIVYPGEEILDFLDQFKHISRLTIVGGEPLIHPEINNIISRLPYSKIGLVRLTTNLTVLSVFDYKSMFSLPFTLCVSLDGHSAEIHNEIRGNNSFEVTTKNIELLLSLGYNIEITHTVSGRNLPYFSEFLSLCQELGIKRLNLHRISLQGNALKNPALSVSATQWVEFRDKLESMIAMATGGEPACGIHVRYPVLFVTRSQFDDLIHHGQYHHHADGSFYADGDRLVLYPDGRLYISSEAFGTECFVGDISAGQLQWNDKSTSELSLFRDGKASIELINALQGGDRNYPVVLSVSYKRSGLL